jgi:hypothetical protein
MTEGRQLTTATFTALVVLAWTAAKAGAAQCGSTVAGFEAWKKQFADEARGRGVSASTVAALMATNYATATIAADRGQRSFGLSLDQFLAKRGGSAIVARRAHSSNPMRHSLHPSSNAMASRRGRSWSSGGWRRPLGVSAGIRTPCRLSLPSPTTAAGRPISRSSSMQLRH